jgi:DNA-binding transcriptional ArsR family regulator/catechol 2,3-dioxygenase-like lactoylglutathione lyase family enzyme
VSRQSDRLFRAVADPTRRRILDLLAERGPLTVGELAAKFPGLVASGISKHLMGLRAARLVQATRRGREQLYSLQGDAFAEALAPWLARYERHWTDALEQLRRLAESRNENQPTGTRRSPMEKIDRRLMLSRAAATAAAIRFARQTTAFARNPKGDAGQAPTFRSPMINLYSKDLRRAVTFYQRLGFVETFRTPVQGDPAHIELTLGTFILGIATVEAARGIHGLRPEGEGRWIEIALWTDDTDAAVSALTANGVSVLSPAHDFLDGRLRSAWIADPDGNPIQLVQRKG